MSNAFCLSVDIQKYHYNIEQMRRRAVLNRQTLCYKCSVSSHHIMIGQVGGPIHVCRHARDSGEILEGGIGLMWYEVTVFWCTMHHITSQSHSCKPNWRAGKFSGNKEANAHRFSQVTPCWHQPGLSPKQEMLPTQSAAVRGKGSLGSSWLMADGD